MYGNRGDPNGSDEGTSQLKPSVKSEAPVESVGKSELPNKSGEAW
jgi:hypothetical protein